MQTSCSTYLPQIYLEDRLPPADNCGRRTLSSRSINKISKYELSILQLDLYGVLKVDLSLFLLVSHR